jgi:hypothetical protein
MHMFRKESDFEGFERVIVEAHPRQLTRIPSYCGLLSPWPAERPANWTARINARLTTKELDRVRVSIERGRPYGEETWVRETVKELGLEQTIRPEGRPRKTSPSATETTS